MFFSSVLHFIFISFVANSFSDNLNFYPCQLNYVSLAKLWRNDQEFLDQSTSCEQNIIILNLKKDYNCVLPFIWYIVRIWYRLGISRSWSWPTYIAYLSPFIRRCMEPLGPTIQLISTGGNPCLVAEGRWAMMEWCHMVTSRVRMVNWLIILARLYIMRPAVEKNNSPQQAKSLSESQNSI